MIRFFKKLSPATAVVTSTNARITFTSLNGLVGYFATDVPELQAEFEKCMKEQRYCISEITAEEFTRDYIEPKKKVNGRELNPPWREEIGAKASISVSSPLAKLGVEAVQRVVAVSGDSDISVRRNPRRVGEAMVDDMNPDSTGATAAVAPAGPVKQEFTPKTAKRKQVRKPNENSPPA